MGYVLHYNPSTGTISFWPRIGVVSFGGVVDAGGLDITWPVSSIYTTQTTRVAMEAGSGTCDDDATNYLVWTTGTTLTLQTTEPALGEILVSTITTSGGDITDVADADILWRTLHMSLITVEWTLMRVQTTPTDAGATGDGLYVCRKYDLDATDWAAVDGTNKIVANADTDDYTVLNLAEYDPESVWISHLAAGDLLIATEKTDDEDNARWIGLPFRVSNADRPRIAYVKTTPTGTTVTCYLDQDATGTEITVYTMVAQQAECPNNTTNLDDVIPRLIDGDPIAISKMRFYSSESSALVDYWMCLTTFQPSEDCVCS